MTEQEFNTEDFVPTEDSVPTENDVRDPLEEDMEPFYRAVDEGTGALFQIGRIWARHGLKVAELALQTSAETLRTTAGLLADIKEKLAEDQAA